MHTLVLEHAYIRVECAAERVVEIEDVQGLDTLVVKIGEAVLAKFCAIGDNFHSRGLAITHADANHSFKLKTVVVVDLANRVVGVGFLEQSVGVDVFSAGGGGDGDVGAMFFVFFVRCVFVLSFWGWS